MKEALMKNYEKTFMKEVMVIHAPFEEAPHTVAFVEVPAHLCDEEMCEIAFRKTNTIEKAWWENEGVTKMFGGDACRSTMTGDYVLIGTKKYKCAFVGWELVC